jgi:hypothetical protein
LVLLQVFVLISLLTAADICADAYYWSVVQQYSKELQFPLAALGELSVPSRFFTTHIFLGVFPSLKTERLDRISHHQMPSS